MIFLYIISIIFCIMVLMSYSKIDSVYLISKYDTIFIVAYSMIPVINIVTALAVLPFIVTKHKERKKYK